MPPKYRIRPGSMFRHKTIIQNDMEHFKYEAKDNRRISLVAVSRVFKKSGSFIFNLGLVNCFEQVIVNLSLVIYAYKNEDELLQKNQSFRLPFMD